MTYLKLYLYFLTFLSCDNNDRNRIVEIGIAENEKEGAAVESIKDKKLYFIDGLSFWKSDVVGKIVKVSGKLVVENHEESKEIIQQVVGMKRIIQKPKWEIVKKNLDDLKATE